MSEPAESTEHIALFQERSIRRTWHDNAWWFSVTDVIAVVAESVQPEGYIKDLRRRDKVLAKGWGQIATPLPVRTEGGVQRINCANTKGVLRLIQSIPSHKAEPFKRWLANIGYERIQVSRQPELESAIAGATLGTGTEGPRDTTGADKHETSDKPSAADVRRPLKAKSAAGAGSANDNPTLQTVWAFSPLHETGPGEKAGKTDEPIVKSDVQP